MSTQGREFSREWRGRVWGAGRRTGRWPICGARAYWAGGLRGDCPTHHGLLSLKRDWWEVQRDEEVFEEILNHADLVVQAVVALK